ncbi:uncharacterized protein Z520_08014 [Fonsecaea multimorphosa CBS 102226]|uniref:Uncharacterized protein n=1 Tax=Fonsecaea multimorphosa CBS 102226 TaxID=1442371 RepID=A0A0D2IGP7_9EURO|nr:uncharacterized protein Z520_08014 [Fonsecaea multimorphosa CBS 102226]KIX96236.1 hypothetical protein Z520_08014 [Fonsecaea multimorphosa CBS 102226]
MATPTLPLDWTPTQAGCLSSTDIWIWDYHTNTDDMRTVLGGPSQTTACFPLPWVSTGAAYHFSCVPAEWSTKPHESLFPCVSEYAYTGASTVTVTDFFVQTSTMQVASFGPGHHLFALGMVYISSALATSTASSLSSLYTNSPLSSLSTPQTPIVSGKSALAVSPASTTIPGPSSTSSFHLSTADTIALAVGIPSALGTVAMAYFAWKKYSFKRVGIHLIR